MRWKKGHSEYLQNNLSKGKFSFIQCNQLSLQSTKVLIPLQYGPFYFNCACSHCQCKCNNHSVRLLSSAATVLSLLLWFRLTSFVTLSQKGQKGTLSSISLLHALFRVVLSCLLSLISTGGLKNHHWPSLNFSLKFLVLSGSELFHIFLNKQLYLLSGLLCCEAIHRYWRVVIEY